MIANGRKDRSHLPKLTEGDEAFRSKFRSWDIGDLSFVDINEYLAVKDIILVPRRQF